MTVYEADGVQIRTGRRQAAVDGLLARHGYRSATLIGAENPFSRRMPAGWNHRMHRRLEQVARRRPTLPATGTWRGWREAHLLQFGDKRPAVRLARIFRQNAVVIIDLGRPVRIVPTC